MAKTMMLMEVQMNELYHHGIKGQKWGVRRSKAELGYPESSSKKIISQKRSKQKRKLKDFSKNNKERLKNKREEILKSPTKLYKYRDQFTEQEIKDAVKRFETNKKLSELSNYEMNTGKRYVDTFLGYADTGIKVYKTFNKIDKIRKGIYKDDDKDDDKDEKKDKKD